MKKAARVPCEYCPGQVTARRITVDLRKGRNLLVVDHVPAFVCDRCGYKEFGPDVAEELRKLLRHKSRAIRNVTVPVFEFGSS